MTVGTIRVSGHKGMSVSRRTCQWAEGRVSGQKDVSVGRKICQWAAGSVSGQKDVSVGRRKSLSVGSKAFQVAQNFLLNTSMYDWTIRCFKSAAGGKNFGSKEKLRKARRRRKFLRQNTH